MVCNKFGTTNTGNVCRKFFGEYETTADILCLPTVLVKGFRDMICMISNPNTSPDLDEYERIAHRTFNILTSDFYQRVDQAQTVQRMIIHGRKYIEHFKKLGPMPMGATRSLS